MSAHLEGQFLQAQKIFDSAEGLGWRPALGSAGLTPEALHARYGAKISRRIRAVLGPDAESEDVLQEVLIIVFKKYRTVRDPACLDGWVAQVTMNRLRYLMRQRQYRRKAMGEWLLKRQDEWLELSLDSLQTASHAMRVMRQLSGGERALLAAHWFGRDSKEALAAEAGCSVSTMRRRLWRARARFEKLARRDPALAEYVSKTTRRSQS